MDKNKKTLYNWARVVLIFAICDVLTLISTVLTEYSAYSTAIAQYPDEAVRSVTLVILGVAVGVSVLMMGAQIFVGIRGINETKNLTGATGYIRVGKTLGVVNVILFVINALGLVGSPIVWSEVLSIAVVGCDAIIMFGFVKYAKQFHQPAEQA